MKFILDTAQTLLIAVSFEYLRYSIQGAPQPCEWECSRSIPFEPQRHDTLLLWDITCNWQFVRLEHEEQLVDVRRDAGLVGEEVEAQFPGEHLIKVVKLIASD